MPKADQILGPELLTIAGRRTEAEWPNAVIAPVTRFGHVEDLLRHDNREWFIHLRWIVVALVFASALFQPLFVEYGIVSQATLLGAAGMLFLANCFFFLHHHMTPAESPRSVLLSLWLQIVFDMLVVTFIVENMESCVLCRFTPLLFVPHIVLGAAVLRPVFSIVLVTLANFLYGGCLVTHCMDGGTWALQSSDTIMVQMIGTWALLFAIWFLTFRLSRVINARDKRLSTSHQEVKQTFETSRSQMYHTAHQMKSPVVAIQSLLELYKFENEDQLSGELKNVLDRIDTRCEHLLESVSDMLFLAKIKARETVNWNNDSIYVDCLVRSIMQRHLDLLESRSIHVSVTIEPHEFVGDPDALERLIDNLVANAIHYSHSGGTIQISGTYSQEGYLLEVRDAGIGISSEDLEDIFKPHFRSIEAKRHHNVSTGLGLPIVRAAADFLGLAISVRSRLGKGSCFALRFPSRPMILPDELPAAENIPAL